MGESRSVAFVDLEKDVVETEEAATANEDALMVGISLGGLLLVVDFTILMCSGQPAAMAAAIVFAAVVLLVMWYVRRTGPYRDEDVDRIYEAPAPPQAAAGNMLHDPNLFIFPMLILMFSSPHHINCR
jgi:hypothetical protein